MMNCAECGAPLSRAAETCEACGARPASGHLNGSAHAEVEEDDGLVYDTDEPRLDDPDEEHDDLRLANPAAQRVERREPSFVRQPLPDDPTVPTPRFVTATAATAEGTVRAGVVRRGLALGIDLVLLGLLDAVLFALATSAVMTAETLSGTRIGDPASFVGSLLSAGSTTLGIGYFSVLNARAGQTLGKAALGIRVVGRNGAPIGIARGVLRTAGLLLSMATLGAGFLFALGPSKRALHDYLADTIVVRTRGNA